MTDTTQTMVARIKRGLRQRYELIADGEPYQVRDVFEHADWEKKTADLKRHDWDFRTGEVVFAEDSNGNFFTIGSDGSISFLDHETDERTRLCESLAQFEERLQEPEAIELPPHKVISVWVDSDFKPEFD